MTEQGTSPILIEQPIGDRNEPTALIPPRLTFFIEIVSFVLLFEVVADDDEVIGEARHFRPR